MKLSLFAKDFLDKLVAVFRRFPVALVYLLILNIWFFCLIHDADISDFVAKLIVWGCGMGIVLSLSLKLWYETSSIGALRKKLIFGGLQAVHLIISVVIANHLENSIVGLIAVIALGTLICMSVYTVPFFRRKTDLSHWQFIISLTRSASSMAILSGGILMAGISLLLMSIHLLFDVDIDEELFAHAAVICFGMVMPTVFLAFVPEKEDMEKEEIRIPVPLMKFVHYLILPILGLYLLVLLVYEIKILVTWDLPRGYISYLVSAAMAGVILVEFLLYPTAHEENNKFDSTVLKLLPAAMVPLLLLMTVGIFRRLSDYGLTVSRLYLLLFNLWCYVVCGMWGLKTRRIMWVSASFAAVFALVSCLPLNCATITRMVLHHEVKSAMAGMEDSMPMDQATYCEWLLAKTPEEMEMLVSKLDYLADNFKREGVEELVRPGVLIYSCDKMNDSTEEILSNKESALNKQIFYRYEQQETSTGVQLLPDRHYTHAKNVDSLDFEIALNPEMTAFELTCTKILRDSGCKFTVPVAAFYSYDLGAIHPEEVENALVLESSTADLYISYALIEKPSSENIVEILDIKGILMVKENESAGSENEKSNVEPVAEEKENVEGNSEIK